jgi:hypothetical protein
MNSLNGHFSNVRFSLHSPTVLRFGARTTIRFWKESSICLLCAAFFVAGPQSTRAQGQQATPAQIEALQKKLDNLQSQMAEVQSELTRLSGTPAKAPANAAEPTAAAASRQGEEKSQAEAELTPKKAEIGQATSTYRTFAQDPLAAPRINNEPLNPRFPGYFRLPGTSTLLRIGGYAKTDFIYDLKPAGNVDSFIPATIPIPVPAAFANSVRPTRLNLAILEW